MRFVLLTAFALGLAGCGSNNKDLSLASKDYLCEQYEFWIGTSYNNGVQPYLAELKRRGEDCRDYKSKADVEIEVKD